jgi:hemoglobin
MPPKMLCWAAGGPQRYSGRTMEESHRHLAITRSEWEAFMDDLQTTLDKFYVPAAEQAEIKALVESTRAAIAVPSAETVAPVGVTGARPAGPQDRAAMMP